MQQILRKGGIPLPRFRKPQLGGKGGFPADAVMAWETLQCFIHKFHCLLVIGGNERDDGRSKTGQVPVSDHRLIAIGIAPHLIDGAEHSFRVISIHERTRAVIDRLARNGHIVCVHHPMDETNGHPSGNQVGLALNHTFKQREIGIRSIPRLRIIPVYDIFC